MNSYVRAMIAGFIATVVLSILMFMESMTLVLHLIWGAVLGATYGALSRSAAV